MLKSVRIENFRCFKTFELQQLGRVNLLVGMNNSGKTSILEAIYLLSSQDIFEALKETALNRGEYIWMPEDRSQEIDIRHLFCEHRIKAGSKFSVFGFNHDEEQKLTFSIEKNTRSNRFNDSELEVNISKSGKTNEAMGSPLSSFGGLSTELFPFTARREDLTQRTQYMKTSFLTTQEMMDLFDQVVLTPEEDLVIQAMKIIEPHIERIASVGSSQYISKKASGGLVLRLSDSDERIPLGSMGDGVWRILGLALAIVNAKDGILLVDEIDAGLHFTAMADMWKLIWKTAKRLNVQVFATTHSNDCWTSLATIANAENPSEEGITIQRIEKGKPTSVVFTERQIAIAAERGIEVR
ncbi:MAG: AAA family ATPase [Thainema sp.]